MDGTHHSARMLYKREAKLRISSNANTECKASDLLDDLICQLL